MRQVECRCMTHYFTFAQVSLQAACQLLKQVPTWAMSGKLHRIPHSSQAGKQQCTQAGGKWAPLGLSTPMF